MSSSTGLRSRAISARNLGKSYSIASYQERVTTAAEAIVDKMKNPFRKITRETFWALKNINFEIEKGDVVGVVGRNGAGKSTLLKVLSRITEPTEGEVDLYGRVGSLLEVGTGFHAELTGRENIYLNGSILGLRKKEIDREFDAIVEFSGVSQFLDTPVKRYSSGMYVRLAFAVAAHLRSEILIVDEVLAVGDAEFQRKCLGKMKDVAQSGRTVLFVSHHMQSVQVLCTKAMFLHRGHVTYMGDVPGAIERYMASFEKSSGEVSDPQKRPGTGELRITSVTPTKEFFNCGEDKGVRFTIEPFKPFIGQYFVSCHVVDDMGVVLLQCDSRMVEYWISADGSPKTSEFNLKTPWLKPGRYRIDFFVCSAGVMDKYEQACHIEILPLLPYPAAGNTEATHKGVVFADFDYRAA